VKTLIAALTSTRNRKALWIFFHVTNIETENDRQIDQFEVAFSVFKIN
jgi:hypothetical protein